MLVAEKPAVVILDLGLPDRSGFDVIAEIRKQSSVPIIVLSARSDERSKVQALDLGADDYIGKPFGIAELMARIRAALRHRFQAQGELPVFVSGDLSIDLVRRHVSRAGQEVKLSPKEFELLRHRGPCRKGADASLSAAGGLGTGARRGGSISPGVHPRSSPET